jgi:tyrosine-protein kinase Etk/Wzc
VNDRAELEIVPVDERLISLRGVTRAIRKRRPLFLGFAIGLPVLAAGVMLLTPNRFTAGGQIVCEMPQGGMALPTQLLGQFSSITGIPTQGSPVDMFLVILRSRSLSTSVAETLKLPDYYRMKGDSEGMRMEKTLFKLSKRTTFDSPDLISIHVTATDKSPQMAADIVNAYLTELETASQTLAFSRARKTRILVEDALKSTEGALDSTRTRLQEFQQRYGVFSIEKQTEGTLEMLTGLQTRLLSVQSERDQLLQYANENSPRVRGLDSQISALRDQITKLLGSLQAGTSATRINIPPGTQDVQPLSELPQLSSEYAKIYIDLQVQEAKYNVLAAQLEQSKIDESKSVPAFEILDRAVPPHRKSGPYRTVFTLAAAVAGTLTGLLLVVILEDLSRRIDPGTRDEIKDLLTVPFRRR